MEGQETPPPAGAGAGGAGAGDDQGAAGSTGPANEIKGTPVAPGAPPVGQAPLHPAPGTPVPVKLASDYDA